MRANRERGMVDGDFVVILQLTSLHGGALIRCMIV
jgi:hypothetical protein